MRSVRLVAFGIILIIVGATSPLYFMLLTTEDDTAAAVEVPLISEEDDAVDAAEDPLIREEDIGAEDKCLQGKFAIPVPDGSLYWQDALLCGKDMRYWMGGAEPPGPIINRSRQEFN